VIAPGRVISPESENGWHDLLGGPQASPFGPAGRRHLIATVGSMPGAVGRPSLPGEAPDGIIWGRTCLPAGSRGPRHLPKGAARLSVLQRGAPPAPRPRRP